MKFCKHSVGKKVFHHLSISYSSVTIKEIKIGEKMFCKVSWSSGQYLKQEMRIRAVRYNIHQFCLSVSLKGLTVLLVLYPRHRNSLSKTVEVAS